MCPPAPRTPPPPRGPQGTPGPPGHLEISAFREKWVGPAPKVERGTWVLRVQQALGGLWVQMETEEIWAFRGAEDQWEGKVIPGQWVTADPPDPPRR